MSTFHYPFDPVLLSMLYTAINEVPPTHRGAVNAAYRHISKQNDDAKRTFDEHEARKCHGDPRAQCDNHEIYNYCWECKTSRPDRAALPQQEKASD